MRAGSSGRPDERAHSAAGSMPSASRSPISRNSSAVSSRVSTSSVMRPWPAISTRISQFSGRFSVAVAWRVAVDVEPAMRAGADAGIFVHAPIDEIVPALGARPRVIGNLVGRQAVRRADLLRHVVERARGVVVGHRELAGCMQRGERRVRLDGELIERKMLAGFARARALARAAHACGVCRGRA